LFAMSFHTLPPGQVFPHPEMGLNLSHAAGAIFVGTIQLAAPVVVVVLATLIALGLLARVAPKMNLFILSFGISVALGLVALRASIPSALAWMGGTISNVESAVLRAWGV
jgi:flagellar biosynthesis protein FliR